MRFRAKGKTSSHAPARPWPQSCPATRAIGDCVNMHVVVMDFVVGYDRPLSDADRKAQGRVVDLPHPHGVVFRDLSTLNTPATPGGRVLLIDFE